MYGHCGVILDRVNFKTSRQLSSVKWDEGDILDCLHFLGVFLYTGKYICCIFTILMQTGLLIIKCYSFQKTDLPYLYLPSAGFTPHKDLKAKPFEVNTTLLRDLGLPQRHFIDGTTESMKNFVFVTAASDNHYKESQDLIGSIQEHYPDKEIIYFDLGLSGINRHKVRWGKYKSILLSIFLKLLNAYGCIMFPSCND